VERVGVIGPPEPEGLARELLRRRPTAVMRSLQAQPFERHLLRELLGEHTKDYEEFFENIQPIK
jgi:hypothetical protein